MNELPLPPKWSRERESCKLPVNRELGIMSPELCGAESWQQGSKVSRNGRETHAFQQVHTPHMAFLTLKKNYNINFSAAPLSLWKQAGLPWVWAEQLLITTTLMIILLMKDPHSCDPPNGERERSHSCLHPKLESPGKRGTLRAVSWSRAVASAMEIIQQLAWYIYAIAVRITVVWHVYSLQLAGSSSGESVNKLMESMAVSEITP